MEGNASAYLSLYLDELEEQLQVLDEGVLKLESENHPDTISAIFRAAHTLKGSSGAMGFSKLEQLTHRLENVFDQIRNRKLVLDAAVFNTVFETVDLLKVLRRAITEGTLEQVDVRSQMAKLNGICAGEKSAASPPPVTRGDDRQETGACFINDEIVRLARKALGEGQSVWTITVRLAEEPALRPVRSHLVCSRLQGLGQILETYPSSSVLMELEPFPEEWSVLYCTRISADEIRKEMDTVSQIESVRIQAWEPVNPVDSFLSYEGPPSKDVTVKEDKLKPNQTIRVDVDRLEHLLNLVGELIIDHTRLQEVSNRLTQQLSGMLEDKTHLNGLHDTAHHLSRVIGELQESMMKTRMLPLDQLFNRFPRMIRDLGQRAGKELDFIMEGKETELDRTLIEELSDPLIHILRNSADHGIETPEERLAARKSRRGHLLLKAAHRENMIVITVSDDGKGIDPVKLKRSSVAKGLITEEEAAGMSDKEAVSLMFRSGVSTATQVTDLSGRGVGMDIVRSKIEKLNGMIEVDTQPGHGTTITIKLPMTLAIMRSLLVQVGQGTFAIPLVNVIEIVRLRRQEIHSVNGDQVCLIRGEVLPLVSMTEKLKLPVKEGRPSDRAVVVVVGMAEKKVGLCVDRTIANQEIVIKNLGSFVGHVPHVAGSTILGAGNVALVLDISSLVRDEGQVRSSPVPSAASGLGSEPSGKAEQGVIFQSGANRFGMDIRQVKEIIPVPELTPIQGAPPSLIGFTHLRGALLPVIHLSRYLGEPSTGYNHHARVIVLENVGQDLGILVDKVNEVIEFREEELERVPPGLYGSGSPIQRILKRSGDMIPLLDAGSIQMSP